MHIGKTFVTVRCVIQNIHDHVLLLRRSPHEVGNIGLWELPGGHIDFGEHPNTSIVRETFEESGIKIKRPSVLHISSRANKRSEHSICISYLAYVRMPGVTLSIEHDGFQWVSPQTITQLPMTARTTLIMKDYAMGLRSNE